MRTSGRRTIFLLLCHPDVVYVVLQEEVDLDVSVDKGLQKLIDTAGAGVSVTSPDWLTQLGRLWGGKSVCTCQLTGFMLFLHQVFTFTGPRQTMCCLAGCPCRRCQGRGYTRAARGRSVQSVVQVDGGERASVSTAHR